MAAAALLVALLVSSATAAENKSPRAVLIEFYGPITPMSEQYFYRKLDGALANGANLVVVEIDSPGGLVDSSLAMAARLRDLKAARTVAYIPREAISGAAMMALGCDEIIMGPRAMIGDAGPIFLDEDFLFRHAPEKFRSNLAAQVRSLAESKGRSPALAEAMVDMNLVVHQVRNRKDGRTAYMSQAELDAAPDGTDWEKVAPVHESREGHFLQLSGARAVELGLAQATVESRDALKQRYGVDELPILRPTAIDTAVYVLNLRVVTAGLLVVGLVALYIELSSPGIGAGGLIAGLCFALFFWSRFLGGTAGWLEILLFAAGLGFLAVELFILPGFGLPGVSGIVLVLASLVMAGQSRIPQTRGEWTALSINLAVLAGSLLVVGVVVYLLSKYLGRLPVLSRLMLGPAPSEPPPRAERGVGAVGRRASDDESPPAVGDRGVAVSPLRPAGKARFGDRLVDVVADGEFIERQTEVEVADVLGNRVVVRPARDLEPNG